MAGLTPDKWDNYIEMEEEQGYKFTIHFFKENETPAISVGYVPMDYHWMDLPRDGKYGGD